MAFVLQLLLFQLKLRTLHRHTGMTQMLRSAAFGRREELLTGCIRVALKLILSPGLPEPDMTSFRFVFFT